ncbi:MAG: class I SAM-dependent methyltransferase [Actinomycetota bacterium]
MGSAGDGLAGRAGAGSAEVRSLYDDWAPGYDADVEMWGYAVPGRVAELIADRVPSGRVLDAGCGTGLVGVAIAVRNPEIDLVGIDVSPTSVTLARERNVYAELSVASLDERLDATDGSFDAVVCAGVLSYVADVEATLAEMIRVARPGGRVVATHRSDLWSEQEGDAIVERLVAAHDVTASVSDPQPYLPNHDEFGDEIEVIYVTLDLAPAAADVSGAPD